VFQFQPTALLTTTHETHPNKT